MPFSSHIYDCNGGAGQNVCIAWCRADTTQISLNKSSVVTYYFFYLFVLTAVISFRPEQTICIFLEPALLQAFYLIRTTIKFANCSGTSAKWQSSSWKNMAYQIGHLQQRMNVFSPWIDAWTVRMPALRKLSCIPFAKGLRKWALECGAQGLWKKSAWLIQWLSIPDLDLSRRNHCYCYPAACCGNVPCTIRIIERQGWGGRRERAVPLNGWVRPSLCG